MVINILMNGIQCKHTISFTQYHCVEILTAVHTLLWTLLWTLRLTHTSTLPMFLKIGGAWEGNENEILDSKVAVKLYLIAEMIRK